MSKVFLELMATRPDLAQELLRPNWPHDLRRRWVLTQTRPIFFYHDERLVASLLPEALRGFDDIERTPGLPPLTNIQLESLGAVRDLARKHQLSMATQPGDLVFINNYGILHGREAFKDSLRNKRYVVRLWLRNEELAWKLPPELQMANYRVFYDDDLPANWNIAPTERVKFQMYERSVN